MAYTFILRYKVLALAKAPCGGKDTILHTGTDLDKAIEFAKKYSKSHINEDVAVVEFRYTSEQNLEKDFHFDYSCPKWASYLDN